MMSEPKERAAELEAEAAGMPECKAPPDYRGYAHLGTGQYILNHTHAGDDAELIISVATEAEKAGRIVGDIRDNAPGTILQPDAMCVRIRFKDAAGFNALQQQLDFLRAEHFPDTTPDGAATRVREAFKVAAKWALIHLEYRKAMGIHDDGADEALIRTLEGKS